MAPMAVETHAEAARRREKRMVCMEKWTVFWNTDRLMCRKRYEGISQRLVNFIDRFCTDRAPHLGKTWSPSACYRVSSLSHVESCSQTSVSDEDVVLQATCPAVSRGSYRLVDHADK